jgi:nucleoside-diphosphate-sugar epimerase
MRVLVTGGAGYLGSVLSSLLLEANHEVRILDNFMYGARSLWALAGHDRLEIIRGDLCNKTTVRGVLRDVDAIVHLAAIVGDPACARQPLLARAVNWRGSVDLIDASRQAGVSRFVFASTCSNYGRIAENSTAATEDFELRPLSQYAEAKVAVERHLLELPVSTMATTVLRFATLYGLSPRMRFDLTVNEFVLSMQAGNKLLVYGENFWRPYVHVRDAARAIALVLQSPSETVARQVFNVGDSEENYRKVDLVEIIRKRLGAGNVEFVHKAEDPRDYRVSFERIRSHLNYKISRRVPDGVDEITRALDIGMIEDPRDPYYHNVLPELAGSVAI